ncbi:FdtA/QdtA family cupin domain-containing protein [bacterium]|nr:FdtA/QdtA family cupin domain-containing protein [bacterium]
MNSFEFFTLPVFTDNRGSLIPLELKEYIPWEPKRIYYAINNKDGRGGHCHRTEQELFICIQGSMTVKLHDGKNWTEKKMTAPLEAVHVNNMVWHEFIDFSQDAVLLAISSTNYDNEDYVRNFDQFLNETNQ